MALATMLVVAIAVLGSLTVLPAVLAKLGDRVNRGRLPGMTPRGARESRVWGLLARGVTRRPLVALTIAAARSSRSLPRRWTCRPAGPRPRCRTTSR